VIGLTFHNIALVIVITYFVVAAYLDARTSSFISIDKNAGVCKGERNSMECCEVPQSITGTFLADTEGRWNTEVYVCVYMCLCMYVCMFVFMYMYMYIYVCSTCIKPLLLYRNKLTSSILKYLLNPICSLGLTPSTATTLSPWRAWSTPTRSGRQVSVIYRRRYSIYLV
jgi:hypothetical protein